MSKPTQLTLKELRARGLKCGMVERFIKHKGSFGQRKDLFNIIDIIAIDKNNTIGVQSCGQSFSAHLKKMTIEHRQDALEWLENPNRTLELWGWRKVKKVRGGKQMIWAPRIKVITLEDLKWN